MAAKHWLGALAFLTMAVATKAHMIFIRLAVLAAAGLAGLFLLHILAQDYRKIQASRPKAFGLFKRSIQVQDSPLPDLAYSPDVIQPVSEVVSSKTFPSSILYHRLDKSALSTTVNNCTIGLDSGLSVRVSKISTTKNNIK